MTPPGAPRAVSDWPAPTVTDQLAAVVTLPGSKSLTNRYLVLAALAEGPSRLRAPLRSRDTLLMAAALRELGVAVEDDLEGTDWFVLPDTLRGGGTVDCGLAGTVMRFVPPMATLADGPVHFDGDPQARTRPMRPVLAALTSLGALVDDNGTGTLPFTVTGGHGVRGGQVEVDASTSSQFVSGLLLSGARYREGLVLRNTGDSLPSQPHVEMTIETLRDCGVEVDADTPGVWTVRPGPIAALDVQVEPDLSNAAPFLMAAAVCSGTVSVPGWPQRTTQAGDHLRDLLDQMGAEVLLDPDRLTVTGSGEIYGIDVDLREAGELAPVVAAACALATSPSRLRGIAHLRGHETDRLAALRTEINGLGGRVEETGDGLLIYPQPLHGGLFHSYHDHRMATAGAVLGLRVAGVEVENVATTDKTLPGFVPLWTSMVDTAGTGS
jgi:3-phosphoshikimate 1-carboxyvinyltransferase